MQLVAGQLNKVLVENIVRTHVDNCHEVIAIVPYCSSTLLFDICHDAGKKLTFYGRLDNSIPVTSSALRWFLQQTSTNYTCFLMNRVLHAKIIWLRGEGVYIGSANLTASAWRSNIEVGTFLTEEELNEQGCLDDLANIADEVHRLSSPLTRELYDFVVELEKKDSALAPSRSQLSKWFNENCTIKETPSLASVNTGKAAERNQEKFLKEWNETLELLRTIARKLRDYRPSWIETEVPDGVHVDQFLHAFYYRKVRQGTRQPFDEWFEQNKHNPDRALIEQMQWWQTGDYPFESEANFIHDWAPSSKLLLARDKVLTLSEEDFSLLCTQVHAVRDHAIKLSNRMLGLPGDSSSIAEKTEAFGRWLYGQTTAHQKSVLATIEFVLYGGESAGLSQRLWIATKDEKWKIDHLGLSSLGEMVGWAMPDTFPPRNSRTSKALRALGYNVAVY